ncbi:MAG: carbon storage regulator [Planctomyces sp.]|nr:carbon storage regulator [Planctomyces sp.]
MLVLTRKTAETIRIGHDVVIKVISCGRGRVKIGIDAPTDVRVLRGEVAETGLLATLKRNLAHEHSAAVPRPVAG